MGLLGAIGRGITGAGRGLLNGLDDSAMGALTGGGLLSDALGSGQQQFTPTPQQKSQLRTSYLMNIGGALQQGKPIGEGVQQFQGQNIAQIQAAQQAQLQRQRQQGMVQLQQRLSAAKTPQEFQSALMWGLPVVGAEGVKQVAEAYKAGAPPALTVLGQVTAGGADGKPALFNRMSDGTMVPAQGATPLAKVTQQDMGGTKQGFDEYGNQVGAAAPKTVTPGEAATNNRPSVHEVPGAGMFAWNPNNPNQATPVMGPNGSPIVGKVPDTNVGTWSIQEDAQGNPIQYNSKTGQSRPVEGVQKAGTFAKATAAEEKRIGPGRDALQYADDYLKSGAFSGPGDLALQEKFFELSKPSTGFRMNAQVMQKLQDSQSWMNSVQGRAHHFATGTWFTDGQRAEMVKTMKSLQQSHAPAGQPQQRPSLESFFGGPQ